MNENFIANLFDSSDDDVLSRTIDRFADGECSAAEEAELFDRLDATPGAWKQCAIALVQARDLSRSLAGLGRSRTDGRSIAFQTAAHPTLDSAVALATKPDESTASHRARRQILPWSAVALGLAISFAAGVAVAPREASEVSSPEDGSSSHRRDVNPIKRHDGSDGQRPNQQGSDLIASDGGSQLDTSSAGGPEIVNVVYRPSGDAEESSAPLPVYKSDEDWARALDLVVRQSEADLAERRAQLLVQGANLERRIVLHPVATEQGEMLLPVETFQIVPVSLNSFH